MKKMRIAGGILHVGQGVVLELDAAQVDARRSGLEVLPDSTFRATRPLQFKSGEVVGIALDNVIKAERHLVSDVDAPLVASSAKPKNNRRS